jgi:hypothetical protein
MTVLLLAWLDRHPRNLKHAVEKAVAALQAVLQATARAAGEAAFTKERDAKVPHPACNYSRRAQAHLAAGLHACVARLLRMGACCRHERVLSTRTPACRLACMRRACCARVDAAGVRGNVSMRTLRAALHVCIVPGAQRGTP